MDVYDGTCRPIVEQVLEGFSVNDVTHTLHYLLKILDNMQKVDDRQGGAEEPAEEA